MGVRGRDSVYRSHTENKTNLRYRDGDLRVNVCSFWDSRVEERGEKEVVHSERLRLKGKIKDEFDTLGVGTKTRRLI